MPKNIEIVAGADWTVTLDWGSTDIEGYAFYATLKRDLADADTAAAATVDGTGEAAATSIDLTFAGADLADLEGRYYFDVKVIDPSGNISMIPPDGPQIVDVRVPATKRSS